MNRRMGLVRLLAAVCCVVLAGSLAAAQPQRGPGGGPGGFGGPGGGFGFGGLAEVLRREDARKELELLDDQVAQLEKLNESRREKMRDLFSGMRDVPQEQRGEKMRELFQKAQQDLEGDIGKILLPHQMKRAKQLATQLRLRGGVRAMLGDQMAQDLGLTEDQKEKLRAKSEQLEEQLRKKYAELRSQAQNELLQALTPAQQAKWKEMVGEPFEFQREEFARPGGTRQGDEAGGRGRRGGGR